MASLDDPTLIKKHAKNHPGLSSMDDALTQSKSRAFQSLFSKKEHLQTTSGEVNRTIPIAEWTPEIHRYVKGRKKWSEDMISKHIAE